MFSNSVLKLGMVQAVTQLSGNEFQSFIDLFTKDISPILDFGMGGKISMRFVWLMFNGFFERKSVNESLQYCGHWEDQSTSDASEDVAILTPLNVLYMTNASGRELAL